MRKSILLAVATAAVIAVPASAQDYSRRPSFGTYNLTTGFQPDPTVVAVTAGGQMTARSLARSGSGCEGTVLDSTMANAPDVRVNFRAGSNLPLIFSVASGVDTTLVINGPDGSWYCNDDTNGVDPRIRFSRPASGQYDVWIGVYGGGRRIPARLAISEVD